jgi:hypothetical protein
LLALLQEAGLIDDEHAVRCPEVLKDVVAAQVPGRILVPQHVAEHPLRAPGPGVADLFGQLPAVLALRRAQQALKIQARLPPGLGPDEQPAQPLLQRTQLIAPRQDARRIRHHDPPPPPWSRGRARWDQPT